MPSELRLHPHTSTQDVRSTMAEAPRVKSEPQVQGDSVLEVGNASYDLHIQEGNHVSPNGNSLDQVELFKHNTLEYHLRVPVAHNRSSKL
jgi:hypothetical protein